MKSQKNSNNNELDGESTGGIEEHNRWASNTDDLVIAKLYWSCGNKWKEIAEALHGWTAEAVRLRWTNILAPRLRAIATQSKREAEERDSFERMERHRRKLLELEDNTVGTGEAAGRGNGKKNDAQNHARTTRKKKSALSSQTTPARQTVAEAPLRKRQKNKKDVVIGNDAAVSQMMLSSTFLAPPSSLVIPSSTTKGQSRSSLPLKAPALVREGRGRLSVPQPSHIVPQQQLVSSRNNTLIVSNSISNSSASSKIKSQRGSALLTPRHRHLSPQHSNSSFSFGSSSLSSSSSSTSSYLKVRQSDSCLEQFCEESRHGDCDDDYNYEDNEYYEDDDNDDSKENHFNVGASFTNAIKPIAELKNTRQRRMGGVLTDINNQIKNHLYTMDDTTNMDVDNAVMSLKTAKHTEANHMITHDVDESVSGENAASTTTQHNESIVTSSASCHNNHSATVSAETCAMTQSSQPVPLLLMSSQEQEEAHRALSLCFGNTIDPISSSQTSSSSFAANGIAGSGIPACLESDLIWWPEQPIPMEIIPDPQQQQSSPPLCSINSNITAGNTSSTPTLFSLAQHASNQILNCFGSPRHTNSSSDDITNSTTTCVTVNQIEKEIVDGDNADVTGDGGEIRAIIDDQVGDDDEDEADALFTAELERLAKLDELEEKQKWEIGETCKSQDDVILSLLLLDEEEAEENNKDKSRDEREKNERDETFESHANSNSGVLSGNPLISLCASSNNVRLNSDISAIPLDNDTSPSTSLISSTSSSVFLSSSHSFSNSSQQRPSILKITQSNLKQSHRRHHRKLCGLDAIAASLQKSNLTSSSSNAANHASTLSSASSASPSRVSSVSSVTQSASSSKLSTSQIAQSKL